LIVFAVRIRPIFADARALSPNHQKGKNKTMTASTVRNLCWLSLTLTVVFQSGCNLQKLAADSMAPVLSKTKGRFNQSSVPQAAREGAPGLLITLEGILAASPENVELLLLKAELNASFSFGFIEEEYRAYKRDDEDRKAKPLLAWANELYGNSRAAARTVIGLEDDGMMPVIEKGTPEAIRARLKENFGKDEVPGVFWLAFSWGAYINLNLEQGSDVTKDVPRVKALMQWVLDTDESYFNGGAHLFFAMINLTLGKSIGGRPEIGKDHLTSVERITGGKMLMSKVIYCEYYLPQVQTPSGNVTAKERKKQARKVWDEYIKTLKEVMDSTEDTPEFRLQNAVAKKRAEDLYYRADDVLLAPAGVEVPVRPGEEDEDEDEDEDEE
jgi:hypothetical protein